MNIGVLKLCRIYYSDLTITNYTSNEQATQFVLQVFVHMRMLWFLRLPLEALVAKMATREQKAFCVLQFAKTESVIRVHVSSVLSSIVILEVITSVDGIISLKTQAVFAKGRVADDQA